MTDRIEGYFPLCTNTSFDTFPGEGYLAVRAYTEGGVRKIAIGEFKETGFHAYSTRTLGPEFNKEPLTHFAHVERERSESKLSQMFGKAISGNLYEIVEDQVTFNPNIRLTLPRRLRLAT